MRTKIGRRGYCAKYRYKADPVGMGRKSCQYTILEYSVLARLSAHTDWISSTYVFGAIYSSSYMLMCLLDLIVTHKKVWVKHLLLPVFLSTKLNTVLQEKAQKCLLFFCLKRLKTGSNCLEREKKLTDIFPKMQNQIITLPIIKL